MIEVFMVVAVVLGMGMVADIEDMSPVMWGAVGFICSIASVPLMPWWPMVRIALAGMVAFGLLTAYRIVRQR